MSVFLDRYSSYLEPTGCIELELLGIQLFRRVHGDCLEERPLLPGRPDVCLAVRSIHIASGHGPEIREFVQRLPEVFRDFVYTIRDTAR